MGTMATTTPMDSSDLTIPPYLGSWWVYEVTRNMTLKKLTGEVVSRFSQGRGKNKIAHNLEIGVDQIACKIIGLVLSTVLGANAYGSLILLRGYFFEDVGAGSKCVER